MDFLPLFFAVSRHRCLVVGGDDTALRKIRLLHKAGACVHVVSPVISAAVAACVASHNGEASQRHYRETDLDDVQLVIAATADTDINASVSADAQRRKLPVNVVDQPALCTFVFPSIIERGSLSIGISSGGNSPVLARVLRARIESLLPRELGQLVAVAGQVRGAVARLLPLPAQRLRFWSDILQSSRIDVLCNQSPETLAAELLHAAKAFADNGARRGGISVIGTGKGQADMLAFRALQRLQNAECIFFRHDVPAGIVNLARRDAEQLSCDPADPATLAAMLEKSVAGQQIVLLLPGNPVQHDCLDVICDQISKHGIAVDIVEGIATEPRP